MIAKDEASIIDRCLLSVGSVIDHALVVDTGSTDDTIAMVRELPHAVVLERPWVNFGHNRTEAFQLARETFPDATHHLVIDADDTLECDDPQAARAEIAACNYAMHLPIVYDAMRYKRAQVFAANLPWTYRGALHEYAHCDVPGIITTSETMTMRVNRDGARGKEPGRYRRDAEMLWKEYLRTDDPRDLFYCAQSWRDAGDDYRAANLYFLRSRTARGYFEERYVSCIEVALASERCGLSQGERVAPLLTATQLMPQRPEAWYELARMQRLAGSYHAALVFAERLTQRTIRHGDLFARTDITQWRMYDEEALAAFYCGNKGRARFIWGAMLDGEIRIPESERARIESNLGFCEGEK